MADYREQVYAGVLGKIVGVFYGRPVEGWPYEKIRDTFGMVDHYVNAETGAPLHVGDDDLAGTFTFLNCAEDFPGNPKDLKARDFGRTWLDYIIENRTLFWWGGFGRSTEHTAFLRLKQGHEAPESGSARLNGQGVAEQIGAQIFMDAHALMCPNDPEMARRLVRECASVSHDGAAVESACFIASMEAMAFGERNLDVLLDRGTAMCANERIRQVVHSVREETKKTQDFREVRDWLEENYSYRFYPGNCHVIPNLALIIASLTLGGDSFMRAMQYCVSAGWDTDCNGANIGVLNAVRLGLDSMRVPLDFLTPVADRFYNISGYAAGCITDAVRETDRILRIHDRIYGTQEYKERPRFSFSAKGAVQGFVFDSSYFSLLRKEKQESEDCGTGRILNRNECREGDDGLEIALQSGEGAAIASPVMWDTADIFGGYELIGSPILYSTQTVHFVCEAEKACVRVVPYAVFYDYDDNEEIRRGEEYVVDGKTAFSWKIPENHGHTMKKLGLFCEAEDRDAVFILRSIDWRGAPEHFEISGSLRNYDLSHPNMQLRAFTASAAQFSFDSRRTFTVSHTEENGLAVIGTERWKDYEMQCSVNPGLQDRCGLVVRARGLRRYYAFVLSGGTKLQLIRRLSENETVLAECSFPYETDRDYRFDVTAIGNTLTCAVDGKLLMTAEDDVYAEGGCGFLVDRGTFLADDLLVMDRGRA